MKICQTIISHSNSFSVNYRTVGVCYRILSPQLYSTRKKERKKFKKMWFIFFFACAFVEDGLLGLNAPYMYSIFFIQNIKIKS